ncbi:MAG: acetate--CoA ligase family protein [Rhodobacter sp.]|nr:acetate--CoA ligase family protein [Paracoccaceae bacterium]MCC0076578.1 acetate--CoA ligase family protein [Rhodobacter sp.]
MTARPELGAGLEAFFAPNGIAVIGASETIQKIGGRPIHMLKLHGFAGPIYPVNTRGGQVQGVQAYTAVADLPTVPDLAIIAVPPAAVPGAVRDCALCGVRAAVILTSGFAEAGEAALQDAVLAEARGMRLLGPNCLGVVSVANRVIGSFSIVLETAMPPAGTVGIVSQSGNIGSFAMKLIADRGLGVSRFMATGNEADVDLADGIAWLADDPQTQSILCCMETCRDAGRLTAALDRARAAGKPVIVLKIGASERGQQAAASHTGALAASDAVFGAVLARHGALRVHSLEELIDLGEAISTLGVARLPRGRSVALVAASGGFGVMMADAATAAGLETPDLAAETRAAIRAVIPAAGTANPVDATAQMSSQPGMLSGLLEAVTADPGCDVTFLLMTLAMTMPRLREVYIAALTDVRQRHPDRLLVVCAKGDPGQLAALTRLGIPVFPTIDATARGIAALAQLGHALAQPAPKPVATTAPALPAEAFRNENAAKQALVRAGVPVLPEAVVQDAETAAEAAEAMGFPVVLKVLSPDIAHKTEVGGVAVGLQDGDALRAALRDMQASVARHAPQARLDGWLVTPMAPKGVELIAGISRDPVFGPVVMVGMGGIHAEILRDVAVQTAPASPAEAEAMIRSLKLFPVLDGARGRPRADIRAAARTVAALSAFAAAHRDKVAEIDINPLLVLPEGQGVLALDALIVPAGSDEENDQ